ncbi:MAG: hypothetical protein ACRDV0_03020 [Acidimicrobiales bacterium]
MTTPTSTRERRLVRRVGQRPVVARGAAPGYGPVFNAGLWRRNGTYHLFARAVRLGHSRGADGDPTYVNYVSDIVVFTSSDGREYEFAYVLASADDASYEDPRVQSVDTTDGPRLIMTYTHFPHDGRAPWRIGAQTLSWRHGRYELDAGSETLLGPPGVANKDAVVFNLSDGRVAMIHRIHPNMQLAVFDDLDHLWGADDDYWSHYLSDLERHTLITPNPGALGVGAGAPPVRTDEGLLLFFHERRADGSYTMNLALLDPDTGNVAGVLSEPLLSPARSWERRGDVNNVIFVQGAHLDADTIYLTYGAADHHVGAATASLTSLLAALDAARHA